MDDDGQLVLTPGPATLLLSLLGALQGGVSWGDAGTIEVQTVVRSWSLDHLHLRSMRRGRDAGTRGGRRCQWAPHSWQVLHSPLDPGTSDDTAEFKL